MTNIYILAMLIGSGRAASPELNSKSYECVTRIYNESIDVASAVLGGKGTCGGSGSRGGSRAMAIDMVFGEPVLREVKPSANQSLFCLEGDYCSVAITGFGLRMGDQILLIPEQPETSSSSRRRRCPPNSSLMKSAIRIEPRDQLNATSLTVFHIGDRLDSGRHSICYAVSLAFDSAVNNDGTNEKKKVQPLPRDFYHDVGTVTIGKGLLNCTFEEGWCGFSHYTDDKADLLWRLESGNAHKDEFVVHPESGPIGDNTATLSGKGRYALFDSPRWLVGATATLRSSPIFAPSGPVCVSFAYNMNGDDVNALRLYSHRIKPQTHTDTGDWENPAWLLVGNQGPGWKPAAFQTESDGVGPLEVIIEAASGNSELGDIAIDDVTAVIGNCEKDMLIPKTPQSGTDMVCGEVRLLSGEWALDKSWYIAGAVSCAGRGYSADKLNGTWMPCCLPHYGDYTVILQDSFGDGWDGSSLEFRFFGNVITLGQDFVEKKKSYRLVVGLMEIVSGNGKNDALEVEVRARQDNSRVWCMAKEPDAKPPTADELKMHGETITEDLLKKRQRTTISIPRLKLNHLYDVFCYAEGDNETDDEMEKLAANSSSSQINLLRVTSPRFMDDEQIAASRKRMSTDGSPPSLNVTIFNVTTNSITVNITADEEADVWCRAIRKKIQNKAIIVRDDDDDSTIVEAMAITGPSSPIEGFRETGTSWKQHKNNSTSGSVVIDSLYADSSYVVHCFGEDKALPEPNRMTEADVFLTAVSFVTKAKPPTLSILRTRPIADTIAVIAQLDGPGDVWCAARESMYSSSSAERLGHAPTRQQVHDIGATAHFNRAEQEQELLIAGVKPQVDYDIFCYAASPSGVYDEEERDWPAKTKVTSFGKFCELPMFPRVVEDAESSSPFDPLMPDEQRVVRNYMKEQRELDLEGIYRITLFPVKEDILQYLDKNGPFPKRYARVRAGRCVGTIGYYLQYKVGPLDAYEMTHEQIGQARQTSCEGWNPTGPFGRRRRLSDQQDIHFILAESFGYPFSGKSDELHSHSHSDHLQLGPLILDEDQRHVWVGLKTPDGEQVPFFFKVTTHHHNSETSFYDLHKLLDYHMHTVSGILYNGQYFNGTDEFRDAYVNDTIERKFTPVMLDKRNAEKERRRRLQRVIKQRTPRGGLENRMAPEHVEPEGKRFTVRETQPGASYSISYAGWEFTVNNDRDKALQLWNIVFNGFRVAFHAGLEEAMAHYTVQERNWYFIDSWYGGLGKAARKLTRRLECPTTAVLLFKGESLCVYEQDFGRPLRSHWKSNKIADAAPLHGLVLRQIITVSNYDYIFDWFFYNSGNFESMISFTGELYQGIEVPNYSSRQYDFGTKVTESGRFGALHSHWASWRVDFEVYGRGSDNSVFYSEVVKDEKRPGAHKLNRIWANDERTGAWRLNGTRALKYHVVTEGATTFGEEFKGYVVVPKSNTVIPWPEDEFYMGPAAWTKYKVASTVYHESELDACLPRDNKFAKRPAVSLDSYVNDAENMRRKDLVTWISSGLWHVPAIEDWPLTVAQGNSLGWLVKPFNLFEEDPSMDLHNAYKGDAADPGSCAVVRMLQS